MDLVEQVHANDEPGKIIFCSHPPIITLGRATQEGDITDWQGAKLEVSRGGRVTYHGPSQLIIYPIINLKYGNEHRAAKDIHAFLRLFEKCITESLATLGLEAHGKTGEHDTGIWVGDKKIASIGIAVRHWVTYHGAAINIDIDPTAFQGIKPCGMNPNTMSSLQEVLEKKIDRNDLSTTLETNLKKLL
ncbi:MAG: lipoyl(octanoyl) transferase LipB [Bdellovibrionota bacterium]